MSESDDLYSEALEADFRELHGALLDDTVNMLAPSEPLRLKADQSVARAIASMVQNRRAAVVIVDDEDRLVAHGQVRLANITDAQQIGGTSS